MQRGVVIRRRRDGRGAALRGGCRACSPASPRGRCGTGGHSRLAAKGAFAAAAAWALARYAAGEADPYFAPIAALLGVYPTIARSFREVLTYVAGFLLGAALAVPVSVSLGPSIAGIAVVVLAGMLIGGWAGWVTRARR